MIVPTVPDLGLPPSLWRIIMTKTKSKNGKLNVKMENNNNYSEKK